MTTATYIWILFSALVGFVFGPSLHTKSLNAAQSSWEEYQRLTTSKAFLRYPEASLAHLRRIAALQIDSDRIEALGDAIVYMEIETKHRAERS